MAAKIRVRPCNAGLVQSYPNVNSVTMVTARVRQAVLRWHILQGMEGTMLNWKAQECIQIFAVTLAVGTFLALAAVIPA